jgi:hypothetical protein
VTALAVGGHSLLCFDSFHFFRCDLRTSNFENIERKVELSSIVPRQRSCGKLVLRLGLVQLQYRPIGYIDLSVTLCIDGFKLKAEGRQVHVQV